MRLGNSSCWNARSIVLHYFPVTRRGSGVKGLGETEDANKLREVWGRGKGELEVEKKKGISLSDTRIVGR